MLARGAEAMYVTKTVVMIRKTIPVSSVLPSRSEQAYVLLPRDAEAIIVADS